MTGSTTTRGTAALPAVVLCLGVGWLGQGDTRPTEAPESGARAELCLTAAADSG